MTNARWKHGLAVAGFVLAVNSVGLAVLQAQARAATPTAVERVMPRLVVGQEVPATIAGNDIQIYDIPMEKGQYLELIIKQKAVDVIATLLDPQGKQVFEMDITGRSEELILAIAEQKGNYRLQVRRFEQDALLANYGVNLVALKAANQNEQAKVSAYRNAHNAFLEGNALLTTGRPGSSQQALEKFKEALRSYQAMQQPSLAGIVLVQMGNTYTALKDYPRALQSYQQALVNTREVGEMIGEAFALQGIGRVYFFQDDKEEAVKLLKQSLAIWQKMPERSERKVTLQLLAITYLKLKWYPGAKTTFQQVLSMDREQGDRKGEALTLWQLGSLYQELRQYAETVANYEHSLNIFQDLKEHNEINMISKALSEIYKAHSQEILIAQGVKLFVENQDEDSYRKAIMKWEAALPGWRKAGDKSNEIDTLMRIGNVYWMLGQRTKSLLYHEQILKIYREQKNRRSESSMLQNLAKKYHLLGDKNKATNYQQQAFLIGNINDGLAQRQENLSYFQRELQRLQAKGDHREGAITHNKIGSEYFKLGEYQNALDHFRLALNLSRLLKDDEHKATIMVTSYAKVSSVYKALGEPSKALEYLIKTLPLSSAIHRLRLAYQTEKRGLIANIISAFDEQIEEADILQDIGIAYYDLDKKQQALEYLEKSLITKRTLGNDRVETLRRLGVVFSGLGDLKKALNHYQKALSLAKEGSRRTTGALILNDIGKVYFDLGETQKSLEYYQQALPLLEAAGDRTGVAATLYNRAKSEASRGDLQAALAPMQASIVILEDMRTKIISPELRQSYFATVQDRYRFYIQLLMDLHQQNPSQGYDKQAFNISERARARTLLELLAEANANIKEGIDPQLLTQEEILQGQLDATEKQRLEVNDNPNSSAVEKAAIVKLQKDLLAQYLTLQNEIRAKSPKFAVLKYPQPLTLVQVQQQLLDPDTTLLQYSLGKERSFLWVVSRDGIQSHVLPSEKEIETQVKSWRSALLDKPDASEALDGTASRLGRLLLEPAASALKSRRRVIVVPDGALTYAPFAAMRLEGKPLVESHTLLQLPSSSTLALIRSQTAQRLPAPRGLAMVADPIFSGDDPRLTTPARTSQAAPTDVASLTLQRASRALPRQRSAGSGASDSLPRLPGTRREAERILPLFPVNQSLLALDSQANLALLQSPSMKDYRYVHLATHGVFNTTEPALSGVILSLVDQQGRAVNGFLRLNEIFNLNLPAELVVLSACETGLGEQIRGEGMVGLTRGFLYAGSRRLLVSLWKVDDDATAALMSRFYQGLLQDKLSPAQALRAAQNHLRTSTNWDSPYFWSGFVLQGEW